MWRGKKVSVVFPTYNEKESMYDSIQDFFTSGYVDEIIVVNNNAAPGTSEEVTRTKAKEVFEKKQGYGYAIQRGLKEVTGYYIIISEPDGTFLGRDVIKLLAYSDDFDVVFGTRTSRDLILEGANMGVFLKWGNWFIAKMIEFFFNTTMLTDAGCTMRLIKRPVVEKIQSKFTIGGSNFGPEMIILVAINNIRFTEIPLNYNKRVGESSVTGSRVKSFVLGLQMIYLVLNYRIKTLLRIL